MTDPSHPVADIIATLEKLSGPDRELDCLIWAEIDGRNTRWEDTSLMARSHANPNDDAWIGSRLEDGHFYTAGRADILRYTASIDAAITLAPDGWTRSVDATAPDAGVAVEFFGPQKRRCIGVHPSEPIATCIAALRARAFQNERPR